MPKRAAPKDYESDDGFVEDAPKSKKSKAKGSIGKASLSYEMKKDDDDNEFWDISGKRRLHLSEFKGNTMISIREFYEKDGKMLPGKKGVTLTVEQFNAVIEILPQIEGVLQSKGFEVARPQYGQKTTVTEVAEKDEEEKEEEEEEREAEVGQEEVSTKTKSKLDKFRLKKNHEATSDEDND